MNLTHTAYKEIIENLRDGVYIVDLSRNIIYWNSAAESITGFQRTEVVGSKCSDNLLCHVDETGQNLCLNNCPLSAAMIEGGERDADIYLRHKKGHRIPVSVRIFPLRDNNGVIVGEVEIFSDTSGKMANDLRVKELEKLALLDNLTQIANRHYIEREIASCFEELRRYCSSFGVLFIDVDNFKQVNDYYGHEIGDRVLQLVAGTLSANCRVFDVFGRWGGEEFIGVVRNIAPTELEHLAQRLRNLVETSFLIVNEDRMQVTISIGATMARVGDTTASLLARADSLMYQSKASGKNCVRLG